MSVVVDTSKNGGTGGTNALQDSMDGSGLVAESIGLFNGTTFDRQRGNADSGALVTLVTANSGGNSTDQANINGRGVQLGVNITAISGATLTITIQGKDAASGVYYTLLTSAGLTGTGFTLLTVYPGAPTTANVSSPQVLPRTWRVLYTVSGGTVSATVGSSVIV